MSNFFNFIKRNKMKQPENTNRLDLQISGKNDRSSSKNQSRMKNKSPSLNQSPLSFNKRIVSPQKLKILVLSGNELQNNELQFISKCINLIKLDLSHNNITRLNEKQGIRQIKNLRVFNLQANKIISTEAIEAIFGMQSLQIFSYKDNPIQEDPRSEHEIINSFPNLKVINYRVIFVEQRYPYILLECKAEFISKQFEQWEPSQHTERYYLRVLKLQLEYIDNMWMFHNPIVKIQRIWRAVLDQRNEEQKNIESLALQETISKDIGRKTVNQLSILKASETRSLLNSQLSNEKQILSLCFSQWKLYSQALKTIRQELSHQKYQQDQNDSKMIQFQNKCYLTYELQQYYITKRNLKVKEDYQRFLKKIRQKIFLRKMAQIFKRSLYKKVLSFSQPSTSFYDLAGVSTTKRIYFNRVQQHLIENFLAHISKNFKVNLQNYRFGIGNQYVAVRLLDPDTYSSKQHYNPLTYLMWPCMRSVILKKKKFPFKPRSSIIKIKSVSYIKNLNKHLTAQQRKKSNKTYQRIDKFIQNQYCEGLGYFYCENPFILQHLIRMIYYHNIKAIKYPKIIERSQMMSLLESYEQNISIYTQKLLERTTSAVKIQQQWRRYLNDKRQVENIYQKLKKNRAARLIQRFIRSRLFFHRLSFQRSLQQQLKQYDGKDVLVHQKIYKGLQNIIQLMSNYLQLYAGLKINVDKKLTLYHSDFSQKEIFSPTLRARHFLSQLLQSQSNINEQKVDPFKFFHFNSETKIIECNNQKFYQFIFKNVTEAKLRIACFALLTYRMYGGKYLMLLSKSTLHRYDDYVKIYKQYRIECNPFESLSNTNKFKVNILKDITKQTSCPFIFLGRDFGSFFNKKQLNLKKQIPVEFYQKRYQDFPQKYQAVLNVIPQDQQEIKEKQIEEKFLNIKKMLIKQSDIENQDNKNNEKSQRIRSITQMQRGRTTKLNIVTPEIQINKNNPNDNNFYDSNLENEIISQLQNTNRKLSQRIKKTSQKNLTLSQIDNTTPVIDNIDDLHKKTQKNYKTFFEQKINESKKQRVTKYLLAEKQKRLSVKEKKQVDLTKIRQKRRQQKVMNMTLKSFNQNQRAEMLRKKAEQVKQYKRRSLSNSQKDGDQSEFIQQGNFIMQQHLRMNLMRQKLKQTQRIKVQRGSLPKSLNNTQMLRLQSDETKSIRSNRSLNKKRMLFEGKETQMAQIEYKPDQTAKLESHSRQVNDFNQTEMIRKRSYVKKRNTKIGAYIRDPSLVHGVFPQEYYPIQSSKGGITFPKVG